MPMLQVVFNEISAAELSALPTQTQFVLIEAMNVQPDDLDEGRLVQRFGVIERGEGKLYRCRAGDYRVYFAVEGAHVKIHRVLHANSIQDFLFRSNLGSAGEDESLGQSKSFWKLIEEGEKTLRLV
ncbi:MAG: hypothetical protein ACOYMN_04045 [Roseimicrobium sp.]